MSDQDIHKHKDFCEELERISQLDARDGYVDEPIAQLIQQLEKMSDCDELLDEALYLQASAKVFAQSPEELLQICSKLLKRLIDPSKLLLSVKTLQLQAAAYRQLNQPDSERAILKNIINTCTVPNGFKFKKEVLSALIKLAEIAEDKAEAIAHYQTAIYAFAANTGADIREGVARALYQKALLQFSIGDNTQARASLEYLCEREDDEDSLSALWVNRARDRLKLQP